MCEMYIITKKELLEALDGISDDSMIMIQMGGHSGASHPITCVEDSQSVGFWEIRCDPDKDFWEALEEEMIRREGQSFIDHKKQVEEFYRKMHGGHEKV